MRLADIPRRQPGGPDTHLGADPGLLAVRCSRCSPVVRLGHDVVGGETGQPARAVRSGPRGVAAPEPSVYAGAVASRRHPTELQHREQTALGPVPARYMDVP